VAGAQIFSAISNPERDKVKFTFHESNFWTKSTQILGLATLDLILELWRISMLSQEIRSTRVDRRTGNIETGLLHPRHEHRFVWT